MTSLTQQAFSLLMVMVLKSLALVIATLVAVKVVCWVGSHKGLFYHIWFKIV